MKIKAIPYLVSLIITGGILTQSAAQAAHFSLSVRTGPSFYHGFGGYGFGGYRHPYGFGWRGRGYPYYSPAYINYVPYMTYPTYLDTTIIDSTNYLSTLRSPQISSPAVLESGTTQTNRAESLSSTLLNDVDLPDTTKTSSPGALSQVFQVTRDPHDQENNGN